MLQSMEMKKDTRRGYIALIIVSFFWGTTYVASKIGTGYMPGLFVSGVRQFLSGLLMVTFFLCKGYSIPSWTDLKKISIQGLFLLCIANGLLTWAIEFISSGLAAIIAGLVPIFIALFSILLTKSARITKWMFAGLLIGMLGVCTIFYNYLGQLANKSFILGISMALIATLSWSFGTVYTSKQKSTVSILFSVGLQMLISGIVLLIVCFSTGKYVNLAQTPHNSWYALIYLIFFGSLLAYSAYVFAITKLPPTLVSVYAYINPVVAVLLGWMLLREKMNVNMILGTLIILYGVYLVNREFKKQKA